MMNTQKNILTKSEDLILYASGKWMSTGIPFIDSIDPDSRLYEAQSQILKFYKKTHLIVRIIK